MGTRTAAGAPRPDLDDQALLVAVANTGHRESDELRDAAAVAAWWTDVQGTHWSGDLGGEPDLEVLRAARRTIRALTLRNNGVEASVGSDAARLGQLRLRFDLEGGPGLSVAGRSNLARAVAVGAVEALLRVSSRPDWRRMKACPGPDCAWVFVDRSRNASRKWCDMSECGNRAKGAAFRARGRDRG